MYETADLIKAQHSKKDLEMSIVSIGPAGENLVGLAGMFVDKAHAAAHNGVGAVMGSKRLKAIAVVIGKNTVQTSDPKRLLKVARYFT